MTARIDHGRHDWSLKTDQDGYRTYSLTTFVSTDDVNDGPLTVRDCAGLPQPGSFWNFGNDFDDWVWCRWTNQVTSLLPGQPGKEWKIVQEFSNRPENLQRCNQNPITDPLLEPMKISGNFCKYSEEATSDRFGLPIVTSSWEQIRGPQVEFDANRTTVRIEQNVADLQLPLLDRIKNTVNDDTLWGMPRRCVKLSSITWVRKYYGQCYPYFTRTLEFDVNARIDPLTGITVSGFDRDILDEGTKCLNGHYDNRPGVGGGDWLLDAIAGVFAPDPYNPTHFSTYLDRKGSTGRVLLNGLGLPYGVKVRAGNSLYISIVDASDHSDNDIGNGARWIKLASDPANRLLWAEGSYAKGTLVNYRLGSGAIEIYLATSATSNAPNLGAPGVAGAGWKYFASVDSRGDYVGTGVAYFLGDYVKVAADLGPYYVSLVDHAAHTALDISDAAKWVQLSTSPTLIPPWASGTTYAYGALVTLSGLGADLNGTWVCKNAAGSDDQPGTTTPDPWKKVTLTSKGAYDGTANYDTGDYVTVNGVITVQGRIHVEKYDEANFLLLGIPTVLI